MVATNHVPNTFDELFATYYDYVVRLVVRKGIRPQNAEDVAMTILTTFYEKDALSDYDPAHTTTYQGVEYPAKFQTFLSGFVLIYLRHHRDRQAITEGREPVILNRIVEEEMVSNPDVVQSMRPSKAEAYDALFMADLIRDITAHLATIQESSRARVQMKEFFERVLVEANVEGTISVRALAQEYRVSQVSIRSWLARLRTEIDVALEER